MIGVEAWENALFNKYNDEDTETELEFWADIYDEAENRVLTDNIYV